MEFLDTATHQGLIRNNFLSVLVLVFALILFPAPKATQSTPPADREATRAAASGTPSRSSISDTPFARLVSLSTLVEKNVQTPDGKQLGTLKELWMNDQTNQVLIAEILSGGVLGWGEKRYTLPWSAIHWNRDTNSLVANPTPNQLQNALLFGSLTDSPDTVPQKYIRELYSLFNLKPPDKGLISDTPTTT